MNGFEDDCIMPVASRYKLSYICADLDALKNKAEGAIMKLNVTIDRDEDGIWVVECPAIPGCVSQGKTKKEALENIKEAIQLCLEVRAERGFPLTVETRQVEVLV